MSKSDTYENQVLNLLLAAKPIANVADNAAASPLTALSVSLHTADPTDTGTQVSNEATYGGYLRVLTTRTTVGWVVSSGSAAPVTAITFAQANTTSTSTITHFGIGPSTAGAGQLYYSGTVSPNISIGSGVTPRLTTGSSITED